MSIVHDPWKDPNPQPGDFDADLIATDSPHVVAHSGNPNAELKIVLGIEDEDAPAAATTRQTPQQRPPT